MIAKKTILSYLQLEVKKEKKSKRRVVWYAFYKMLKQQLLFQNFQKKKNQVLKQGNPKISMA